MTPERIAEIKAKLKRSAPYDGGEASWQETLLRECLAALDAQQAGWKLVPAEPTIEMARAGAKITLQGDASAYVAVEAYKAMLAAAPPSKPEVTG